MNRILTSFLPLIAVACAGAQAPAQANLVTENSRIARFLTGPGDRPQGALLRNGTFVTFSPGLAQRLPASLARNASLQVVGEEFGYEGSKTIQARTVTIAGVAYNDDGPMPEDPNLIGRPGPDGRSGVVPPPPPPPSAPGVPPPPPVGRGGPPPPHAATPAPPPPPAGASGTAAPPPPVDGATPPPPPANNAGRAAEPPAPATPPAAPRL